MRLPPHPNLLPLDRLVLEELYGVGVCGFTTPFIPGGGFDKNRSRPFKLKWLKQLMGVVDDLNLKFGIMHQDIAPRNLLVDPNTDALLVFDFDTACKIGDLDDPNAPVRWSTRGRDDVKGVMFAMHEHPILASRA